MRRLALHLELVTVLGEAVDDFELADLVERVAAARKDEAAGEIFAVEG